jgi:hypothetical protein
MIMANEIWRYVNGFSDYQVSNMGRVKSNYFPNKQPKIL